MRNNEERTKAPAEPDTAEVASDLSFPSPTEFVDLPSGGRFYPEGSSLHGKESLELRFMTAKEEDILTNKSLLKKGVAIDRLLSALIVDKSVSVDDLLVGDKNALLIAVRISAYGAEYKTQIVCPGCGTKFENNFNLAEIERKEPAVDLQPSGTFDLTLPKTKAVVTCRLLTGKDEKALTLMVEGKKKHKLPETPLLDQLRLMIVSVNGSADKGAIYRFVESLPAFDSHFLRAEYVKAIPDVKTEFFISCPECENESEVTMPLAAEFFWPR
jgi:hypothetical protein